LTQTDIPTNLSINEKEEQIIETITEAANCASQNVPKISKTKFVRPHWWNGECDILNERQMELFRIFRRIGGSNYDAYKLVNEQLTELCNKLKPESFKNYCTTLNSHSRLSEMYSMARKYRGVRSASGIATDCSWLEEFAKKLAPDFPPNRIKFTGRSTNRFSEMAENFTMDELMFALDNCHNSSPGLNNVRFIHLRRLPEIGFSFVLELFNEILRTSEIPNSWKHTKIIAIPKPGRDADRADSYRPISLLSCIRKLFEKILVRLDIWAEKNEIMSNSQFGFRKGRGTADCLAVFSTEIKTAFYKKNQVVATFLDITGAYDNVLVDILCKELRTVGIPVPIIRLIWNLLWEKILHFFVVQNEAIVRTGYKGLPQGSVLSPFFYNFYTRLIDSYLHPLVSILQYADDIVIYSTGRVSSVLETYIQSSLLGICEFFNSLGLTISTQKSESMVFSKKHQIPQLTISLNNNILQNAVQFRYLGVLFDTKLTWKPHVDMIVRKCQRRTNFLKSIAGYSWGAHPSCILILYKSTIRSVIEYGAVCFSEMAETHLKKLERIQWRSARI
jgi:Reverse transcriptase (RNA-dependent DNA polymerase)